MAIPTARLLLVLLAAALLAACGQPQEPTPVADGPIDPDTVYAERDTVATPLAMDETGAVAAAADLQSVGASGVSGRVQFTQRERGLLVLAEVGGLPEESDATLRVLEQRSCNGAESAQPGAGGTLGQFLIQDDGTGRYESEHPELALDGAGGLMGRAVVIASGDGPTVACGIVGPALQ